MRIIVTGPKGSGKSTVGRLLGPLMGMEVVETDNLVEEIFEREHNHAATCREICLEHGEPYFRELEKRAVHEAIEHDASIICTGGQTMVSPTSRAALAEAGTVVFIRVEFDVIWKRVTAGGIPAYFPDTDQKEWFRGRVQLFNDVVGSIADIIIEATDETPDAIARDLADKLRAA